jgi:hypothetical protein
MREKRACAIRGAFSARDIRNAIAFLARVRHAHPRAHLKCGEMRAHEAGYYSTDQK